MTDKAQGLMHKPLTELKGVGPALAKTLEKLGIFNVQDVLFHLPMRYMDRTRIVPIGDLQANQSVVIQGRISACQVQFGRRRSLYVRLQDSSGEIGMRFFHFSAAQKAKLEVGTELRCYGETRLGSSGVEIYHPEYDYLDTDKPKLDIEATLTPVYPSTEGLNQNRLRAIVGSALAWMRDYPPEELLPKEINEHFRINSLSAALAYVHNPPRDAPIPQLMEGLHPYQQRLAFEELLAHHFALQQSRQQAKQERAPRLELPEADLTGFVQQLPFSPTRAQQRVISEIRQDLLQGEPMLRLIQGDVGSGKTLVAAVAALAALACGYQCAVAAPTEILAEQHRDSFSAWLEPLGYETAWLVGKLTPAQKRKTLEKIASGQAKIVIGTHALFEEHVNFNNIGLVIIDEQHRFGVHQRLSLRNKAAGSMRPHQLVMTATPIPRTLAMTYHADLDLSIIDELPPGRTPVNTVLVSQSRREEVIERVRSACQEGRQAYWVCTLVENSETLSASNAEETTLLLREALPELNVALIHGRMKAQEKEQAMAGFKSGATQLLVATTVIEVGVDVPNASLMIIENPERLGLAQLHQLRGRVGRGSIASHCVLLYGTPLSKIARQRLGVLRSSCDGFEIADQDLKIRGPGELLGTRQTGHMNLRLADIQRDAHLIPLIHSTADQIFRLNPQIGTKLINRWFFNQENFLKG